MNERIILSDSINDLSKSIIMRCRSFSPENRPSFGELLDLIVSNRFMLVNGIEREIPNIRQHLGSD